MRVGCGAQDREQVGGERVQKGGTLGWTQCLALTLTSRVVSGQPPSLSGRPLPGL